MGVLITLTLLCSATSLVIAAENGAAKQQAMQMQGKQYLDIALEQHNRGLNEDAKAMAIKAQTFRDYLTPADKAKLDELYKSLNITPGTPAPAVQSAPAQNTATADLLTQARSLAAQGKVAEAKARYMQAKQSGNLTPDETAAVDAEIAALDSFQGHQQQQQPGVNNQYIKFVPAEGNDINKPSSGVTPVEPNAQVPSAPQSQAPAIEPNKQPTPAPTSDEVKENYIETVQQKQKIQQSYTKAVVNEAVAKAKDFSAKNDFAAAKDEISRASSVVEKNKMLLGDEDYKQYTATLQQLTTEVDNRQAEVEKQNGEKAKAEAQASQQKLRAQQAADKQKRIEDLLARSSEYQEQQKYEEALAQVETLLAIDPTNREGAIRKQMLQDIINLRTQLEIKREIGEQEQEVFTDNQRSMIPHADLITYPRNWQDITAKRKTSIISGMPKADADVYEQLQKTVDLSALTPETTLSEAIDIIKNSVDPPLKIVVFWKDLADNAYIEQDTPIGMQGFQGAVLGEALRTLLTAISGGVATIDYMVKEGIITIATKASLPPGNMVTKVYSIADIIVAGANFEPTNTTTGGQGGGGKGSTSSISQSSGNSSGTQNSESVMNQNTDDIITIIQETIAPDTWLVNGGEGTITRTTNDYMMIISQTPQVHLRIEALLDQYRKAKGEQVSIEARFLFVTENFLEDIGIDTDILIKNPGGSFSGPIAILQDSSAFTAAGQTGVPGSIVTNPAMRIGEPGPGGTLGAIGLNLFGDDLQLNFLIRATQAHRDAKVLTAPKVTVISGERANISVLKESAYVSDYEFEDITASGDNQPVRTIANPTINTIVGGVTLNVTPTISDDKKYVGLLIISNYTLINLDTTFPVFSNTTGQEFSVTLPTQEVSDIRTHVSVPDGGTLLIGGQKLGAEVNKEEGVPGVAKVPVLGRLFSNRSKVKDQDILLILVKPSIIIKEEAEQEFFAPLQEK